MKTKEKEGRGEGGEGEEGEEDEEDEEDEEEEEEEKKKKERRIPRSVPPTHEPFFPATIRLPKY